MNFPLIFNETLKSSVGKYHKMSFVSGVSSFTQSVQQGIDMIRTAINGCLKGIPIGIGTDLLVTGVALMIPGLDIPASAIIAGAIVSAIVGCVAGGYFSLVMKNTTYQTGTTTAEIVEGDEALFNQVLNGLTQSVNILNVVNNYMSDISKGFEFDVAHIVARDLDNEYQLEIDLNTYIQDNVTAIQNALNSIYQNILAAAQIYAAFIQSIPQGVLYYNSNSVGQVYVKQISATPGVAYILYQGQNGTYKVPIGFALNVTVWTTNMSSANTYLFIFDFVQINTVTQFSYVYVDLYTSSGVTTQSLATNLLSTSNAGTNTNDLFYEVVSSNTVYGVLPMVLYAAAGSGTFPGVQGSPDIIYPGGETSSTYFVIPVQSSSSTSPIVDLTPLLLITEVYDSLLSSVTQYAQSLYQLYTQLGLTPQQALASLGVLNVSLLQPLCLASQNMYNDMMLQLSIAWNSLSALAKNIPSVPKIAFPVYGQWLKVTNPTINGSQFSGPIYLAFDRPQVVIPAGRSVTYDGAVMVFNPADQTGNIIINPTLYLPGNGYFVWRADLWFYQGQCHRVPVTQFVSLTPSGTGFILSVNQVVTLTGSMTEPGWSVNQNGTASNSNPVNIQINEGSNTVYYLPYNVAYAVYTPQGLSPIQTTTTTKPNVSSLIALALILGVGVAGGIYLERKTGVSYKVESGARAVYRTGQRVYRATRTGYQAFRQTLSSSGSSSSGA